MAGCWIVKWLKIVSLKKPKPGCSHVIARHEATRFVPSARKTTACVPLTAVFGIPCFTTFVACNPDVGAFKNQSFKSDDMWRTFLSYTDCSISPPLNELCQIRCHPSPAVIFVIPDKNIPTVKLAIQSHKAEQIPIPGIGNREKLIE